MFFKINYDDNAFSILEKVEKALNDIGIHIEFEDDGEEHDGYCIIKIIISE